jgi:transposase
MATRTNHNTLIRLALSEVSGMDLEEAQDEIGVSYETIGRWRRALDDGDEPAGRINKKTRAALLTFLRRKSVTIPRETQVSREPPVNTSHVEALSEAAGTLELMAMGLRQKVANLRGDSPVAPAPLRTADEDQRGPTDGGACG